MSPYVQCQNAHAQPCYPRVRATNRDTRKVGAPDRLDDSDQSIQSTPYELQEFGCCFPLYSPIVSTRIRVKK